MKATTCTQCGSDRVHRSHCRHILERLARVLGGGMLRCHDCNLRYVKLGGSLLGTTRLARIWRRLVLAAAMVVAALVVMLSILWYSRSQANPPADRGRVRDVMTYRQAAC